MLTVYTQQNQPATGFPGMATGVLAGTTTITATLGLVSGSTLLTVGSGGALTQFQKNRRVTRQILKPGTPIRNWFRGAR